MAANETLLLRVRENFAATPHMVEEKKMFGGICFMVNDKMCVGVKSDGLMVRFDPEETDALVEMEGTEIMVMGSREMKGYMYVAEEVLRTKKQLDFWLNKALAFNKHAKSSKKKQ
ncbi:TfoX/Sxy family protein [Chitinophaga sp. GCM10012297]|uniref:TfoX/Sxy family protein n=1 Tax=Chitinophaga chungangae TaxID=2821488 RepID=A0ABS3YIL0_9BACT|nr:TfoX/Sxy family protein [Chitinophaga chungangae]MBO9154527.1 TfoX/Sxy family protein [Chitinophaga chungangae]